MGENNMIDTSELLISICITSYNRPKELLRCLKSIDSIHEKQLEIIVSEDCSPRRDDIVEIVEQYKTLTKYKIFLNLNDVNVGYDGNLEKLISLAKGKYVLLISDDDMFVHGALDQVVYFLQHHECGMLYTPFVRFGVLNRKYRNTFVIKPSTAYASSHIYDSILFSGLVFRREYVCNISATRFKKLNYFQVYLFLYVMSRYTAYYYNYPLIDCIEDGENAYGIAASNDKNPYLADRTSIFSNIEFHKGLITTIKIFESDEHVSVMPTFAREYSLRTYGGCLKHAKLVAMNLRNIGIGCWLWTLS